MSAQETNSAQQQSKPVLVRGHEDKPPFVVLFPCSNGDAWVSNWSNGGTIMTAVPIGDLSFAG